MKKILFIFITLIAISCKKDNPESISEFDLSINQFIWNNMSNYYLWSDYVPALNSNNYSSKNDIEENLLRKYSDHEKFFDTLLYSRGSVDKYSFIVNNYENYEASNNGSGRSMGFYYKLFLMYNKEIIGLVMYVVKGGPADRAGIKRGDFFTEIDGSKLTPANYKNLLSKDSYNISLAKYSYTTETIEYSGVPQDLTSEIMQENPIFLDTVYSINSHKVGYIIYNYFDGNYDNQLNMIFSKFKQENISDLILDLRYNGGGEYTSAINLASMIYTTDENKIFGKNEYNKALQQKLVEKFGEKYLNSYFTDKILNEKTKTDENINSLNFSKIYVIITQGTAATSEMFINNLMPYISVYTFGNTTQGHGLGSLYIKDYDPLNPLKTKHKWAMQLITTKSLNVNGNSFFNIGISPSKDINENYIQLLPLGDTKETLLNAAISKITSAKSALLSNSSFFEFYADKNDLIPHRKEIILNNFTH